MEPPDKFASGGQHSSYSKLQIRSGAIPDVDVLTALNELSFGTDSGESWTADVFAKLIAMPGTDALIALGGEQIVPVGSLVYRVVADECEIITLGVTPEARRNSVATRLLTHMFGHLQAQSVAQIFLEVADDNPTARSFYQALGFAEVAIRPGYYSRPNAARVDARILRKNLASFGY